MWIWKGKENISSYCVTLLFIIFSMANHEGRTMYEVQVLYSPDLTMSAILVQNEHGHLLAAAHIIGQEQLPERSQVHKPP